MLNIYIYLKLQFLNTVLFIKFNLILVVNEKNELCSTKKVIQLKINKSRY